MGRTPTLLMRLPLLALALGGAPAPPVPPFVGPASIAPGTVPWGVSLPDALGPLPGWHLEWWYYSGVGILEDGAAMSIQFEIFRGDAFGASVGASCLGLGLPGANGSEPGSARPAGA